MKCLNKYALFGIPISVIGLIMIWIGIFSDMLFCFGVPTTFVGFILMFLAIREESRTVCKEQTEGKKP